MKYTLNIGKFYTLTQLADKYNVTPIAMKEVLDALKYKLIQMGKSYRVRITGEDEGLIELYLSA